MRFSRRRFDPQPPRPGAAPTFLPQCRKAPCWKQSKANGRSRTVATVTMGDEIGGHSPVAAVTDRKANRPADQAQQPQ